MLKKTLLFISTLAIVLLLFALYQWQDRTPVRKAATVTPAQSPATQMATDAERLRIRGVDVPPGEKPFVVVYDTQGRPKIRFRSDKWHAVANNEFHMTRPEVRLILPGGEPVHATADEGQVVVAREEQNNYDPKRGWLRGNVHILIDRTDERWREAHPDRQAPEQHPEYVVHIWLEDLRFDLDLARLESDGAIRIESHDATVEGTGLVLVWNEVDRRVDLLEIARGKRMELRRDAGLVEFAMPGGERAERTAARGNAQTRPAEKALAARPKPKAAAAPKPGKAQSRPTQLLTEEMFLDVTKDRSLRPKRDQMDTYSATFAGPVVVSQKRDGVDVGSLRGDLLELLFDFGEAQKEAADVGPGAAARTAAGAPGVATAPTDAPSKIELVWAGKMTIHPVPVKKGEQTGDRFHAVASGNVVVTKGTSEAACNRLEFHNETEKAWLSGSPVRMRTVEGREMTGEKIFYDRRAGLAQVDGPGTMIDPRRSADGRRRPGAADAGVELAAAGVAEESAEQAVVRWTRRVELKFGMVRERRLDSRTGQAFMQEREYLRAATLAGDVEMSQPGRSLRAETVDLTFAEPPPPAAAADQLAGEIGKALGLSAEENAAISKSLAATISDLMAAGPEARRAAADRIGGLIAAHATGPGDRQAVAETLAAQVAGILATEGPKQPAAVERLAREIVALGPPRADRDAAAARLGKAVTRLFGSEGVAPQQDILVADRLERMTARGRVRFQNRDDVVTAGELHVVMTTDPDGRSVPAAAEARENITATRKDRHISARDRLTVEFVSVPAPAEPIDRAVVAARARSRGIDPATIDWKALEERQKNRREIAVVHLEAFGDVRTVDPEEKLNLTADELRCWMPDGRQIEKALVIANAGREAEVELGDYYVRAPRIDVDVKSQCAKVPSSGVLRFRTYQDLSGERLEEPLPVLISWSKDMAIDGDRNVGVFTGGVRAVSRDTTVDCQELRVTFADVPPATEAASRPATGPAREGYWIFDALVNRLSRRGEPKSGPEFGIRKRPVQLVATGDARALSSSFDPKDRSRLLSRVQIDGPQLVLDLESDQLTVNGAGHLLIEDYRMPQARQRAVKARAPLARDPFGTGLQVESPSQTLFTWQNAMSFFARRNVAVFDRDVTMTHLGGSAIKLAQELAQAMRFDVARLQAAKGRRAGLRCDNLVVEFLQDRSAGTKRADDPTPLSGATELRLLRASGRARLEEGTRSVEGDLITFNRAANQIRVYGSIDAPAQLLDQDEAAGKLWRWWGDSVTYNLENGQIDADWSVVSATGG